MRQLPDTTRQDLRATFEDAIEWSMQVDGLICAQSVNSINRDQREKPR